MSRSARRLRALAAAAAGALVLAGCAGQVDLSKSVSNRTTVKAAGGFGAEALRLVDPCGLLTDDLLATVGKKVDSPSRRDYNECDARVKESNGVDTAIISVKIGDNLFSAPKQTSNQLNGLPVYSDTASSSCSYYAVTGREPDRGISVRVNRQGEDPCKVAQKFLEAIVKRIAENPPKYPETPGSLVALDTCVAIDDATARTALGDAPVKEPYGIHECVYEADDVSLRVGYAIGGNPMTTRSSEKPTEVELAPGIKGAQWKSDSAESECDVEWVHRELAGPNSGENVRITWERASPKAGEDPCAKALAAAKAIAPTLKRS